MDAGRNEGGGEEEGLSAYGVQIGYVASWLFFVKKLFKGFFFNVFMNVNCDVPTFLYNRTFFI